MLRITISLVASIMAWAACMAGNYRVTATVTDSVGEPLPYATVRVYQSSDSIKPAALTAADTNGAFNLPLPAAGSYRLNVTAVGLAPASREFDVSDSRPTANLGTITLVSSLHQLGEVTVTAQRPIVIKEIDRLGYDVQADQDSKTSSVLDILRKVPLVTINPDGEILVNGSSSYKIYRNGRPNQAYSQNAKELFKGIPASTIKKIEVITDPGAREDAEGVGAILNIVTMDNVSVKGVAGSVGASANSIEWYPNNVWANLTTQFKKFTISPYGGFWGADKMTRESTTNDFTYDDTHNRIITHATTRGPMRSGWWGFDSSLEIDSLNLINIEYSGNFFKHKSDEWRESTMSAPDATPIYSFRSSTIDNGNSFMNTGGAVNYQRATRRKGETITLSYQLSYGEGRQQPVIRYYDTLNFPMPYTGIIKDTRYYSTEHTAQLDWSRPYGSIHKLDLGGKYIYRRNHSDSHINYVDYQSEHTDFVHDTHVAALYADYRATLKRVTLRGGLRYEYSHLGGHYLDGTGDKFGSDLNDLVPNFAASYNINDANTIKASYSMRVKRPGVYYLNPAVEVYPTSQSSGNPHLKSANHNQFNLNYTLTTSKLSMDVSTGYSFSDNGIISTQRSVNDILYTTYSNSGHTRSFTANLYLQWMLSTKTSLTLNGNCQYQHYANPDALPGITLKNHGWTGYSRAQLSQTLPWRLRGTASISYWAGYIAGINEVMRPTGAFAIDHTLSLERSFLKDNRLTVRLSANNPFGPYSGSYKVEMLNSGISGATYSHNRYNSYGQLTLSYNFGTLNTSVKKAKGITNDDVQGGSRQGASGGGK